MVFGGDSMYGELAAYSFGAVVYCRCGSIWVGV